MRDKERWAQIVKSVHFYESVLDDRAAAKRAVAATLIKASMCGTCGKAFASERALAAHDQRTHGYRTEWSKRVDDSGVCPACKATFHTRIRVMSHVRSGVFNTQHHQDHQTVHHQPSSSAFPSPRSVGPPDHFFFTVTSEAMTRAPSSQISQQTHLNKIGFLTCKAIAPSSLPSRFIHFLFPSSSSIFLVYKFYFSLYFIL